VWFEVKAQEEYVENNIRTFSECVLPAAARVFISLCQSPLSSQPWIFLCTLRFRSAPGAAAATPRFPCRRLRPTGKRSVSVCPAKVVCPPTHSNFSRSISFLLSHRKIVSISLSYLSCLGHFYLLILTLTIVSVKNCQLSVKQVNPRQYVAEIPQVCCVFSFFLFLWCEKFCSFQLHNLMLPHQFSLVVIDHVYIFYSAAVKPGSLVSET